MNNEELQMWPSVQCPWCGELTEIMVEADVTDVFVQDCEVCCRPWEIQVSVHSGEKSITVRRS